MNKEILKFAKDNNLGVIGSSCRGKLHGFDVCISYEAFGRCYVEISVAFYLDDDKKRQLVKLLEDGKEKYMRISVYPVGIIYSQGGFSVKKCFENLLKNLEIVWDFLNENKALGSSYCSCCGIEFNSSNQNMIALSGVGFHVCDNCKEHLLNEIANQNITTTVNSKDYLIGSSGAAIATLIIGLIWAALFWVGLPGFLLGIIAATTPVLAIFAYVLIGGKPSKKMNLYSFLISVVGILLTIFIVYSFYARAIMDANDVAYKGFAFFKLMDIDNDFFNEFCKDFILAAIFTGTTTAIMNIYVKKKVLGVE